MSLTLLKNLSWCGRPYEGVELSLVEMNRGPLNFIYSLGISPTSNRPYCVEGMVFPRFTYCFELLWEEMLVCPIPMLFLPIVMDSVGVLLEKSIEFLILYRLEEGVRVTLRCGAPFFYVLGVPGTRSVDAPELRLI
jgi:hypothetical protein